MQTKEQKISPIKQRILQFATCLGMSKRDFYAQIGVSRGTLESNTGITEDILAKFIVVYPDISLDWLLLDHGPMFRASSPPASEVSPPIPECNSKDAQRIAELEKDIETLKERLSDKNEVIASKKSELAAKDETIKTKDEALKECLEYKEKYIALLENGSRPRKPEATRPDNPVGGVVLGGAPVGGK